MFSVDVRAENSTFSVVVFFRFGRTLLRCLCVLVADSLRFRRCSNEKLVHFNVTLIKRNDFVAKDPRTVTL